METITCPKGHSSTEPDFCSECGAKIQGVKSASTPTHSGNGKCPDCEADRAADGGVFCEVCGYNFATGAHGEVPVTLMRATGDHGEVPVTQMRATGAHGEVPVTPMRATNAHGEVPVTPPQPTAAPAVPQSPPPKGWTVTVTVDPSLGEPESPAPPAGVESFTVNLDKPVSLIGRRSESRAVFPEIVLNFDAAVSHRHALLERVDGGALLLRDIGAANGTRLNGKDIAAMVDTPLKDGDEITLGHWTRITVKAVH
jgi:hypothetical protein